MKLETERLGKPIQMRFKRGQIAALVFLSESNDRKQASIARTFLDFGIKLTKLNGGQVPLIEQVRLQQQSFAGLFRRQFHKRRNRR